MPTFARIANVDAGAAVVVSATPAYLVAASLRRDGADATLLIYDNASAASGTLLAELSVTTSNEVATWCPALPIRADAGITAIVTGAGATGLVAHA